MWELGTDPGSSARQGSILKGQAISPALQDACFTKEPDIL